LPAPIVRDSEALSSDDMASLVPTSLDLFDPLANPDSTSREVVGSSSHRPKSSHRHNSKKRVAFAI